MHATIQPNLEKITLSESSQAQRPHTHGMTPFIGHVQGRHTAEKGATGSCLGWGELGWVAVSEKWEMTPNGYRVSFWG